MALPGGRREPADQDLLSTAIRETHEELGVVLGREHFAGSLDDVVPRTPVLPPVAVRPFVFMVPDRLPLTLNDEVAAAQWVCLDALEHPERHRPVSLEIAGVTREVQAFRLDDAIVWGMTERILANLIEQSRE